MQVDLSSGGYKVVASGFAFLFGDSNELTIHASDDNGFDVCVTMVFINEDGDGRRIKRDILDDRLVLSCYNFEGIGTGLARPAYIADANGKKVFLMFWTYEEGTKKPHTRSVKYTLFYED